MAREQGGEDADVPIPSHGFRKTGNFGAVIAGVTASAAAAIPSSIAPGQRHHHRRGVRLAPARRPGRGDGAVHPDGGRAQGDGLRWQGIAKAYGQLQAIPDVVERYAATHSTARD